MRLAASHLASRVMIDWICIVRLSLEQVLQSAHRHQNLLHFQSRQNNEAPEASCAGCTFEEVSMEAVALV